MADASRSVRVEMDRSDESSFVRVAGVLDATTYQGLRDSVIKAALEEPRAVIIDVDELAVPVESAWSVFTSARWYVSVWPDVPILLVCADHRRRAAIGRSGVTRYVPVHSTRRSAVDAVADRSQDGRRRARTQLPASRGSLAMARRSVTDWLTAWDVPDLIPVASTLATVLVDNVLTHTQSEPVLIVEYNHGALTVAAEDSSSRPAMLHEDPERGAEIVSGLGIIAALCRSWGSTPTTTGKTVWALVGSENQF